MFEVKHRIELVEVELIEISDSEEEASTDETTMVDEEDSDVTIEETRPETAAEPEFGAEDLALTREWEEMLEEMRRKEFTIVIEDDEPMSTEPPAGDFYIDGRRISYEQQIYSLHWYSANLWDSPADSVFETKSKLGIRDGPSLIRAYMRWQENVTGC